MWHEAIISDHMYGTGTVSADCGIDHGYDREVIHKMEDRYFAKESVGMEGRGNMQIFVDMAKTLAVFCLLEQVILNLLPSGTYERYVKFYLGLLLLILLLQPVLQLFHLTGQLDSRVFTSAYEWEEQAETWKTEWKLPEDWQER